MVNEASGFGTSQLPDKEGQMYFVGLDNLYLIPTAEVPITNLYRDVILKADELPVKNCGHTPCFRREAGSYGSHVRGLNRLHQFDKVEIVQIQEPEKSYEALEEMSLDHADLADAENRGDMAMVHKVLSAQSLRLKKMEPKKDQPKPPPENSSKESNDTHILDAFDELRWT